MVYNAMKVQTKGGQEKPGDAKGTNPDVKRDDSGLKKD
jgi:hypothetical protein